MAKKTEVKSYNDFSGGIQSLTSPLWQSDREADLAVNVDISIPGVLRKAKGYTELGTSSGSVGGRGLSVYENDNGARTLIRTYGTTIERYATSWEALSGVTLTDNDAPIDGANGFIDEEERMYFAAGLDDGIYYYNGTTTLTQPSHTDVNSEAVTIAAKYVEVYQGKLVLGNVSVNGTHYPIRILLSETGTDVFDIVEGFIDDLSEPIRGLKVYNDVLYVFGENKVGAYDGAALRTLPGNHGTTSNESIAITRGRLLWFNAEGVYMSAGAGIPQLASRNVQEWVDAVTDASQVYAGIDDESNYNLYIGDVTVNGINYTDVVLVYDLLNNGWTVRPNRPFKYFALVRDNGGLQGYATDVTSEAIWEINSGSDLNGSAIESEWRTPYLEQGNPQDQKYYKTLFVTFEPQGTSEELSIAYRTDDSSEFTSLNTVSLEGNSDIKMEEISLPNGAEGNFLQLQFTHSSSVASFKLFEYSLDYVKASA